jgi:hypothetical protein
VSDLRVPALAVGLLAGLTLSSQAQQPRPSPSPSPRKETPSYTGDDLDRLAGRTPGEAPAKGTPTPTPDVPQVNETEAATSVPDLPVVRAREGNESEGPDPALGSWADRAQALRDQLAEAEAHVKDMDSQAQALLWQYLQSTDTYEILRLKAEQQEIFDQIPDAKKAVEDARKALADFETDAARAGVSPSEIKEKKKPEAEP